jgi:hypothetical protein
MIPGVSNTLPSCSRVLSFVSLGSRPPHLTPSSSRLKAQSAFSWFTLSLGSLPVYCPITRALVLCSTSFPSRLRVALLLSPCSRFPSLLFVCFGSLLLYYFKPLVLFLLIGLALHIPSCFASSCVLASHRLPSRMYSLFFLSRVPARPRYHLRFNVPDGLS